MNSLCAITTPDGIVASKPHQETCIWPLVLLLQSRKLNMNDIVDKKRTSDSFYGKGDCSMQDGERDWRTAKVLCSFFCSRMKGIIR